jgi:hypothetical protein
MTFLEPELGQQAYLFPIVGAPNGAAKQDEAAVTVPCGQHLARMPRERCSVKGDEHQTTFGARDQQRRIVQAKPGCVLPPCDVNDREPRCIRWQAETSRCDVFSSPSRRGCAGLFVTRGVDFFGECLGVCKRSLDEYPWPAIVARRLFDRAGSSCTARTSHTATRWPSGTLHGLKANRETRFPETRPRHSFR